MPFDGATIKNARIRPNHGDMELDVAMETKGSHYSRSRGEQYARLTEGEGTCYFKRYMIHMYNYYNFDYYIQCNVIIISMLLLLIQWNCV